MLKIKQAFRRWLKQLRCPHDDGWELQHIGWDGESTWECTKCGKVRKVQLS